MRLPALPLVPRLRLRLPRLPLLRGPHLRRRLIAVALLLAAAGSAYMVWFRDSSLVRVERVRVVGLSSTPNASALRARLERVARGMTTLHLDPAALRHVVAGAAVVHSIALRPDFPHGLTIDLTENRPVAVVSAGGSGVPVAADGTVLKGLGATAGLPVIRTVSAPAARRVARGAVLDRVTVAAAAPPALLQKISSISIEPGRGFVARIAHGPSVWLGALNDIDAKWAAAAAVLAQRSSAGATYVDVRILARPIAGGLRITATPQPDAVSPTGGQPGAPAAIPADPGAVAPSTATPAQPASTVPQAGGAAPASAGSTVPPTASSNTQP